MSAQVTRMAWIAAVFWCGCGGFEGPPEPQGSGCDATSIDLTEELTSSSAEALLQVSCYRQRMGMNIPALNAALSEAAQLHAEYLDSTGEWGHLEEDTSIDSYRAATPGERATAAGFPIDDNAQSISELLGFHSTGSDPSDAVDLWFDTVYHRPPMAIPELEAVGFGSAGIYDVLLVVSPWEADFEEPDFLVARYPVSGQDQVPRSFDTDREAPDPVDDRGEVGFPISLSFLDQSFVNPSDLYGITVEAQGARLTDSEGTEIPSTLFLPSEDEYLMRTLVLLPNTPLEPETSYDVTLRGSVGESEFDESWSFETGL